MSCLQVSPLAPCSRAECITFQNTTSPECPHSPVHVNSVHTGRMSILNKHALSILKIVKEENIIEETL